MKEIRSWFSRFARAVSQMGGHPFTFAAACAIILLWAITGPIFHFSDTWQLVINTGTTIITFLMVFILQNSQTRDTSALQLKLDELIRSHRGAHNALLDLEQLTPEELEQVRKRFEQLAKKSRSDLKRGLVDTMTKPIRIQVVKDKKAA